MNVVGLENWFRALFFTWSPKLIYDCKNLSVILLHLSFFLFVSGAGGDVCVGTLNEHTTSDLAINCLFKLIRQTK